MPRLPSGRLIAVGGNPYRQLIGRVMQTNDAGLLLFFDKDREFAALIEVLCVEWRTDLPATELEPLETADGVRHGVSTPAGFTAQDVLRGRVPWSRGDVVAFRKFLESPRVAVWQKAMQGELVRLRGWLTDGAIFRPDPHAMLPRACFRPPEMSASKE
ncbi:MAG: hypothetical protein IAE97_11560 [Chthoniobacterales bacterium]|nr:hypothetical protein [Chthoniobacterales bacterium]